jgi:hypothetical protein
MELSLLARILGLFGLILLIVAGILFLLDRLDLTVGDLPGDIRIKRGNFTCVVPLISSLIISAVLTLILNLALHFLKK